MIAAQEQEWDSANAQGSGEFNAQPVIQNSIQKRKVGLIAVEPLQGCRAGGKRTCDRIASIRQCVFESNADSSNVLGNKHLNHRPALTLSIEIRTRGAR